MTGVPEIARRYIGGQWKTGVAEDAGGGSQARVSQWTDPVTIYALTWQTVDLSGGNATYPDAGAFTLIYDGDETVSLDFDATAAEVVAALAALPSLAGKIAAGPTRSGVDNGPLNTGVVSLLVSDSPPGLITIGSSSLTNSGVPTTPDVYMTQEDVWNPSTILTTVVDGDVIEDARIELVEAFGGPGARGQVTDSPDLADGEGTTVPPDWAAPLADYFDLAGTPDGSFDRFTGNTNGDGKLFSAAGIELAVGGSSASAILPTRCTAPATIRFFIRDTAVGTKAGLIRASVKVARAS